MLSLGVVTAAFRAPWGGGSGSVGWGAPSAEAWEVTFEETEPQTSESGVDLVSRHEVVVEEAPERANTDASAGSAHVALPEEPAPRPKLEELAPILEFAEQAPTLIGGLGDLYLHIRYPQAAIDRGIQGRVVLKFVVEPDGRTSEIVVEKPLHPLCDSAAVQALRGVAFMPGRQNGEAARVRMRLPVRFELVDQGGALLPDSALATAG